MSSGRPRILLDGLTFGECPRWRDGKLWFSDQHACQVRTVDLQGRTETIAEVPEQPSGLGFLPDGRLLVVSMKDRRLLRLDDDRLSTVADLSSLATFHCNDMVVDEQGRAYVGNFGFDLDGGGSFEKANIILVDTDGAPRVVATELAFPNGTVITPDGKQLIVAESFAAQLTAFDIGPDGSLSNRRLWAKLETAPDGICMDAAGAIWVSCPLEAQVLLVREGGDVAERIPTSNKTFACMLGGETGHTLFIMSAESSNPAETRARQSGAIEIIDVSTPHAGLP